MHIGRSSFALVSALVFAASAHAQEPPKPKTAFTGDLGFVSATGNTELTTLNVDDKLVHTDGRLMLTQIGSYIYGETAHEQTADQTHLGLRADYSWAPRLGGFVGASYDRNTFAGYDRRFDEELGIRWRAIDEKDDSLNIDVGGVLTQQTNVDTANTNYPSGRVGANYKHSFTKTAYFQEVVDYIPDLKTSGAYRADTESSLVAPLSAHLGIKVDYLVHYNSNPPPKFGTTDRILTTGIQITW